MIRGHRTRAWLAAATASLAFATGTNSGSATTTAAADVAALVKAEAAYAAILAHYKPTGAWLATYKAALAVVTSDQAKVTTDLTPPKSNSLTKIVLSMTEATNPPTFHQPVAVTFGPIVNPAIPVYGNDLSWKPGWQPIAITFAVTNLSKLEMVDDANSDATVVGSNGQVYNAAMSAVTACTNFSAGVYSLEPNQAVVGCVAFDLPPTVTAEKVQWSGEGEAFVQWTVK